MQLVNTASEAELGFILREYGEEKSWKAVARRCGEGGGINEGSHGSMLRQMQGCRTHWCVYTVGLSTLTSRRHNVVTGVGSMKAELMAFHVQLQVVVTNMPWN